MSLSPRIEGFVYIAGPYRPRSGKHDASAYDEIDENIQRARKAAQFLAEHDIPFFCPHLNSAHFETDAPDVPPEFWLRMDLTILIHAAAVLLVDGWEHSKGAQAEVAEARKRGISVFTPDRADALVVDWQWASSGEPNAIRATE